MTDFTTFRQQLLDSLASSLGVTYEQLSSDYDAAETADDISWRRERAAAYRQWVADFSIFKSRWDGAINRMCVGWCEDIRFDNMGLQRGLRP